MSFYTCIKTKLDNRKYVVAALVEMKRRGEIVKYVENRKKETIEVDAGGDAVSVVREKSGNYGVAGDNRVVGRFSKMLKKFYALESIKDNLPLDFEITEEQESGGEIKLLLKG